MSRSLSAIDLSGDHHIHTSLCNHARGEMEEYILAAIARGLDSITFLEHLECGIIYNHRTWLEPNHFKEYFFQGKQLQKQYAGRIAVRLGVEVGYNPAAVRQLRAALTDYPFEHIGLSYHFYFDGSRHLNMLSRRPENVEALIAVGVDHVLEEYFNGLLQACRELQCDKICHLDAGLRHIPDLIFKESHYRAIEQLLTVMQQNDIALEVNTAGFDLRSQTYPSIDIINYAGQLSIPLVAGSDAHRPDQVGRHFGRLAEMLA